MATGELVSGAVKSFVNSAKQFGKEADYHFTGKTYYNPTNGYWSGSGGHGF